MTDDPILAYFAAPTRDRFTALIRRERNVVFAAAWRVLGDRGAAEDVTQELFMRVLDADWGKREIRDGRGFLVSQAIGMARTHARGERRRKRREEVASAAERVEDDVVSGAVLREVRDAVFELPEGARECVELCYFGGLKASEIAEQLGCALRTVNERLQAARERLRGRLSAPAVAFLLPHLETDLLPPAIAPSAELGLRLETLAEGAFKTTTVAGSMGTFGYAVAASVILMLAAASAYLVITGDSEFDRDATLVSANSPAEVGEESQPDSNQIAAPSEAAEKRTPSAPQALTQAPARTALLIRVSDAEGNPVLGSTLHIQARKLSTLSAVLDIQEGEVSTEIEALLDPIALTGTSEFFVEGIPASLCNLPFELGGFAPGFATAIPQTMSLTANETTEVELRLPLPRRAGLRILDRKTENPIAGAVAFSVSELERRDLDPEKTWQLEGPGRGSSDGTGLLWLEELGAGSHQIEIVASGYGLIVLRDFEPDSEDGAVIEVKLDAAEATGRIRVRVQDPFGEPIRAFPVVVSPVAADSEHEVLTDDDGFAVFEGLSPDWYKAELPVMAFAQLSVERGWTDSDKYHALTAELEELGAGEELDMTLGYLQGTARWSLVVLNEQGDPIAGEEVSLNGPVHVASTTDEAGRCLFEHLPAGEWGLSVGSLFESYSFERDLLQEGEHRNDRVTLGSARIEGRVVIAEEGAEPVKRAFLMLSGDCVTSTHAGEGGSFSLKRVPPGEYRLTCVIPGYAATNDVVTVTPSSEVVTLEVQVVRGGSVVVHRTGAWAEEGSTLELRDSEGNSLILEPANGETERYESPLLEPGRYSLEATAPGREVFTTEVVIENGSDTIVTIE